MNKPIPHITNRTPGAFIGLLAVFLCLRTMAGHPTPDLDLVMDAPIDKWDEAIPLGNGTMGVLLWGADGVLRLSLDRGDLWDERSSPQFLAVQDRFNWKTMQNLVTANRMAEFNKVFDANYDYDFAPTKLPAGRIEIPLAATLAPATFRLKLATAEGQVRFKAGQSQRSETLAGRLRSTWRVACARGRHLENRRRQRPARQSSASLEPDGHSPF
jgi:alpha-L-fucosidase 2